MKDCMLWDKLLSWYAMLCFYVYWKHNMCPFYIQRYLYLQPIDKMQCYNADMHVLSISLVIREGHKGSRQLKSIYFCVCGEW